jgi:hypothetical protein
VDRTQKYQLNISLPKEWDKNKKDRSFPKSGFYEVSNLFFFPSLTIFLGHPETESQGER